MIDTPTTPQLDNQRDVDNHIKMEARLTKLETNADSDGKTLESLSARMDDGFKSVRNEFRADMAALRSEIRADMNALRNEIRADMNALRDETHAEISGLRNEMHSQFGLLRSEMLQLRTELAAIRHDMNRTFMWFMGIQTTTIFAVVGIGARALRLI
ncbi:coiled-coil domain-containing protein [Janthinobacterium fluminis]|uniref:DUF1640 domain-containing protein n=1 Tax=Janthinobacterium fluminis TaxID=2987524 RepID=A0ABT5K826_9BURK|nr:coiled-coil domain-containing protein [Janthinobacterium fluminis]MDC8760800.1 DUF1640 domain-containing protein [Janthinobacterium fluminis]